jgi:subtilisin family serine protease
MSHQSSTFRSVASRTRWLQLSIAIAACLGGLHATAANSQSSNPASQASALPAKPSVSSEVIDALARDEQPAVLVKFRGQADTSAAYEIKDREQRARYVYEALNELAQRSQAATLQRLQSRFRLNTSSGEIQQLWIANSLSIKHLTPAILAELESSPDIESILVEEEIPAPKSEVQPLITPQPTAVVSSLTRVKVPEVWSEGYRGDGIVIANIDTGVRFTHESLVNQYRGKVGEDVFDHQYNWFDPYNLTSVPITTGDHGSHVMGTMVGDNGSTQQIGAAPAAKWVNCLGFGGLNASASTTGLLQCGQWMIAPTATNGDPATADPAKRVDIVNNSWSACTRSHSDFYDSMIEAWHAAGISAVFANGNNTNCSYALNPPVGTVGSPASSGIVLAVGSTGASNGIYATHSNKGPTTDLSPGLPWAAETFGYADLKPNIVAPGVDIISAYASSDSTYGTMTGTSMSAPLTAGVIGLMWDAAPCLRGNVARTSTILMETATRIAYSTGSPSDGPGNIPNQATGWGEINALNAVNGAKQFCSTAAPPSVSVKIAPDYVPLGDPARITITLANYHPGAAVLTSDFVNTLPANLELAANPDAQTDCSAGTVLAEPGASSFRLNAGAEIPAVGGTCSLSVNVVATEPAFYTPTVTANSLQTSHGNNAYMARATFKSGMIFPEPYCVNNFPTGLNPITKVVFGSINNSSSAVTQPPNEDFLSLSERVQPGNSVSMRVEGKTGATRHYVVAYVDWNQDGVFYAGDEATVIGSFVDSDGLDGKHVTADIRIPETARPGQTRMRVIMRTNGESLACSRANAGSAEEYTIIVGGSTSAPTLGLKYEPAHTAAGETSRLTMTLSNKDNNSPATLTHDLVNNLPAGVVVASTTPNAQSTCSGGTLHTSSSSIGLGAGAVIPANGSCEVSVDVVAASNGLYGHRVPEGSLRTNLGENEIAATASLKIGYEFPQPYCPVAFHTAVVPITKVQFADINNATSNAIMTGPWLENFTSQVAHVVPGDVVPLRVEYYAIGAWDNPATAYIDWNQNYQFDADEAYPIGGLINSTGIDGQFVSVNIPVPLNAKIGPTRMRIFKHFGAWENACNVNPEGNWNGFGGDGYGQAEDYTVEVSEGLAAPNLSTRFTPAMGLVTSETELATTINNVTNTAAELQAPFTTTVPAGLEVLNAQTTCEGSVTFTSNSITLAADSRIPANTSCVVRATVRANAVGEFTHSVAVGNLVTSLGANLAASSATFKVSSAYTFPEPYCPTHFQFAVYPITRVAIAGIDNRSSDVMNGSPAHENYVSIPSGSLSRGGTYPIIVEGRTLNTNDPRSSDQFSAFIDWNMDGVFAENETYFLGHLQRSTGTDGQFVSRDIVVPADAPLGPKRMRVSKMHDQPAQACRMVGAGQAEDYTLVVDDLPAQPNASIDPVTIALSTRQGMLTSSVFDISNTGRGSLHFDIQEAFGTQARRLASEQAAITARVTDPSRFDAQAKLRAHPAPVTALAAPSAQVLDSQLSQMDDNAPVSGFGAGCTVGTTPTATRDTSWWRRFYFAEHAKVGNSVQIDSVTIASEVGPSIPVEIHVYTIPRSVAVETIDRSQLTLIGTGRGLVGGTLSTATIPLFNTVVADTKANDLVVEYAIEGSPYALFLPGANDTPQTHRSFMSSTACGIPNPSSGESLGFDEFHLIMLVNVSDPSDLTLGCGAPSLVPWLSTNPAQGIVDGNSSLPVTVTADTSALALGNHYAKLCIDTNDSAHPRFEIPVSLEVLIGDSIFVDGFDSDSSH